MVGVLVSCRSAMIACVSAAEDLERRPVGRVNGEGEDVNVMSLDGVELKRRGGSR